MMLFVILVSVVVGFLVRRAVRKDYQERMGKEYVFPGVMPGAVGSFRKTFWAGVRSTMRDWRIRLVIALIAALLVVWGLFFASSAVERGLSLIFATIVVAATLLARFAVARREKEYTGIVEKDSAVEELVRRIESETNQYQTIGILTLMPHEFVRYHKRYAELQRFLELETKCAIQLALQDDGSLVMYVTPQSFWPQ